MHMNSHCCQIVDIGLYQDHARVYVINSFPLVNHIHHHALPRPSCRGPDLHPNFLRTESYKPAAKPKCATLICI